MDHLGQIEYVESVQKKQQTGENQEDSPSQLPICIVPTSTAHFLHLAPTVAGRNTVADDFSVNSGDLPVKYVFEYGA